MLRDVQQQPQEAPDEKDEVSKVSCLAGHVMPARCSVWQLVPALCMCQGLSVWSKHAAVYIRCWPSAGSEGDPGSANAPGRKFGLLSERSQVRVLLASDRATGNPLFHGGELSEPCLKMSSLSAMSG
jgi:hypothetical protein